MQVASRLREKDKESFITVQNYMKTGEIIEYNQEEKNNWSVGSDNYNCNFYAC